MNYEVLTQFNLDEKECFPMFFLNICGVFFSVAVLLRVDCKSDDKKGQDASPFSKLLHLLFSKAFKIVPRKAINNGLNYSLARMTLWPETLWLGHFGQKSEQQFGQSDLNYSQILVKTQNDLYY